MGEESPLGGLSQRGQSLSGDWGGASSSTLVSGCVWGDMSKLLFTSDTGMGGRPKT